MENIVKEAKYENGEIVLRIKSTNLRKSLRIYTLIPWNFRMKNIA